MRVALIGNRAGAGSGGDCHRRGRARAARGGLRGRRRTRGRTSPRRRARAAADCRRRGRHRRRRNGERRRRGARRQLHADARPAGRHAQPLRARPRPAARSGRGGAARRRARKVDVRGQRARVQVDVAEVERARLRQQLRPSSVLSVATSCCRAAAGRGPRGTVARLAHAARRSAPDAALASSATTARSPSRRRSCSSATTPYGGDVAPGRRAPESTAGASAFAHRGGDERRSALRYRSRLDAWRSARLDCVAHAGGAVEPCGRLDSSRARGEGALPLRRVVARRVRRPDRRRRPRAAGRAAGALAYARLTRSSRPRRISAGC